MWDVGFGHGGDDLAKAVGKIFATVLVNCRIKIKIERRTGAFKKIG